MDWPHVVPILPDGQEALAFNEGVRHTFQTHLAYSAGTASFIHFFIPQDLPDNTQSRLYAHKQEPILLQAENQHLYKCYI